MSLNKKKKKRPPIEQRWWAKALNIISSIVSIIKSKKSVGNKN